METIPVDRLLVHNIGTYKSIIEGHDDSLIIKSLTTENSQANSILEIIHRFIANLVLTFDLQNNYLDEDEPWSVILAAKSFAVQSKYHITVQTTPGHMIFGRDVIINTPFIVDLGSISLRKQKLIDKQNQI